LYQILPVKRATNVNFEKLLEILSGQLYYCKYEQSLSLRRRMGDLMLAGMGVK